VRDECDGTRTQSLPHSAGDPHGDLGLWPPHGGSLHSQGQEEGGGLFGPGGSGCGGGGLLSSEGGG